MKQTTTRSIAWKRAAALFGVLILLVSVAGPTVLAQQSDGVTVSLEPAQQSGEIGDTVTYDVVVQNADTVGAAEADITLSNPAVATITDITLSGTDPASNPLAAATVGPDGDSATFAAAYGNSPLDGDGTDITIATITVEGDSNGETDLELSGVAIGSDVGASYTVSSMNGATFTVGDTEAPTTEEPTTEEPTTDEPTTDEPTEEPTTEEPTTEEPTTDEPTEEPTTEEPTTEEPTTDEPTEEPTTEEPTTEEPTTEKPTTEEPPTEEPPTEEPPSEEPSDETYYQVDFVVGEPKEQVGPDSGFYSDEKRLIRFAHGVDEQKTRGGSVPSLAADAAACLNAGYIQFDDGMATVSFTVQDGCELTLSLVSYEKPGPGFDRSVTQELVDSSTKTFGPGEYTLTVDLPGTDEAAQSYSLTGVSSDAIPSAEAASMVTVALAG